MKYLLIKASQCTYIQCVFYLIEVGKPKSSHRYDNVNTAFIVCEEMNNAKHKCKCRYEVKEIEENK